MDEYLGVAEEQGLSKEELEAVKSIVMAVSAGRVRAQLKAVRVERRRAARRDRASGKE